MPCATGSRRLLFVLTAADHTTTRCSYIHKESLVKVADRYPELSLRLKRCARTEVKVNKKGRRFMEAMQEAKTTKSGMSAMKLMLKPAKAAGGGGGGNGGGGSPSGLASRLTAGGGNGGGKPAAAAASPASSQAQAQAQAQGAADDAAAVDTLVLNEQLKEEMRENRLMLERLLATVEELKAAQLPALPIAM
eukprot:SAG22_NODE_221_length_14781_cov_82.531490_15_plen_192_part_00